MLIHQIKDKKDKIFVEKINRKIGKAINKYELIQENDHIMIALSGGKDSLVLLDALAHRLNFSKEKYKLTAVHIKLNGLSYSIDKEQISAFCKDRNVEFLFVEENVDITQTNKTPCFICSHTRRRLLFETAKQLKCNKLAFGHHMDDAVETLLMNMIYHADISGIPAKIDMFGGQLQLIRPLISVRNKETKQYSEILKYPLLKTLCSFEDITKRKTVSSLLNELEKNYPKAINNIFASIGKIDNL